MKAHRFTTRATGSKVQVFRHTIHYPRGTVATSFKSQASADYWIVGQVAEDHEDRVAKIVDYLAERAARVPAEVAPSNQFEMFA